MITPRIFATAKPSSIGGPVLPMDPEQRQFLQLRKERSQKRKVRKCS